MLKEQPYTIINSDFRVAPIEPDSVDCIITDPPYGKDWLPFWGDLGIFAQRVLKDHGWFAAYTGHMYIVDKLSALGKSLSYYWTISVIHNGGHEFASGTQIRTAWKPIVVFSKGKHVDVSFSDVIGDDRPSKENHLWEQGTIGAEHLVKDFSQEGDLILDSCLGSGTTVIAALKHNRRAIGIEIDPETCQVAQDRISNELRGVTEWV